MELVNHEVKPLIATAPNAINVKKIINANETT